MRAVPAKNTSIEIELRKLLWAEGLRGYRLHDDRVPGHPDVIFSAARVAVFVDGCFWHGCKKCYREPRSNQKYWQMKVQRNRDRDLRVNAMCEEQAWHVVRVWEHEIGNSPRVVTRRIMAAIKKANSAPAVGSRKSRSRLMPGAVARSASRTAAARR